jgi:hypothetical protein
VKLDTARVVERHYWTIELRGEYRSKDGEDWYERFETAEAAEKKLEKLVAKKLVVKDSHERG